MLKECRFRKFLWDIFKIFQTNDCKPIKPRLTELQHAAPRLASPLPPLTPEHVSVLAQSFPESQCPPSILILSSTCLLVTFDLHVQPSLTGAGHGCVRPVLGGSKPGLVPALRELTVCEGDQIHARP